MRKVTKKPNASIRIENCSFTGNTDDSAARLALAQAVLELAKGLTSQSALLVIESERNASTD